MITNIRHPLYNVEFLNWQEWRLTYEGGWPFVNAYLQKFSDKETEAEFSRRKQLTPVPAFAKMAVDEIKNAIFQRLSDVTRDGGDATYQTAVTGSSGGVDLHGSTMNYFMGESVLLELLIMGRVGVFVDSPPAGPTAADIVTPYVYRYRVEDIMSWTYHPHRRDELSRVLLRDYETVTNDAFGLPNDIIERFRLMTLTEDGVLVEFFKRKDSDTHNDPPEEKIDEVLLDLPRIPFTLLSLPHSIIADITRHQIALLNLESSDMAYALESNFPTFTEQKDLRDFSHFVEDGEQPIEIGNKRSRTYGKDLDPPSYVSPPTEPFLASMEKQKQLKSDLRDLVHLAISNIGRASAESKEMDQRGLEAGLSQIGLVLEYGERRIAEFWADYVGSEPAHVSYPLRYNLRSEAERRAEATSLVELRPSIVSRTFQNEITFALADNLVGHKLPQSKMKQIKAEIESADAYTGDLRTIMESVSAGILDNATAAKILGYPESVVAKAAEEHAERLARIQASQSAARGVSDAAVNPQAADDEKEGKEGRGEGRFSG
jgi:hypothetical protein